MMFQKLRRKFILTAMLSVFLVLGLIIASINLISYFSITSQADHVLDLLAYEGGRFPTSNQSSTEVQDSNAVQIPDAKSSLDRNPQAPDRSNGTPPPEFDPETPFHSRYFSVTLSEDNQISGTDLSHIASIDQKEATQYAQNLIDKGKPASGYYGRFRYRLSGQIYLFLDTLGEQNSFYQFLWGSLAVSAGGLLLVLILLLLSSRRVLSPILESYQKQRQFITDANHELKTPLAVLMANNEVIEMEHGSSEWTRSNERQIARMTALVEKLVLLSRMDEETQVLRQEDVSLSKLLLEVTESFDAPARAAGKRLGVDIKPSITIKGDPAALEQMLSLLLDNAIKYSDAGGSIQIRLENSGKHKLLEVYNSAEQLPQGDLSLLFERFYRLDASRNSKSGGFGIGLSVVRAIAEQHQAKLSAYSDDGKSLRIQILFP